MIFFFSSGAVMTGQRYASELLLSVLSEKKHCFCIKTPSLNRTNGYALISILSYCFLMLKGWLKAFFLLPIKADLHLNLGQTYLGFLREGLPYYFLALRNRKRRKVISLHGSVFLEWKSDSRITRYFLKLVSVSDYVTCLGENQKQHLIHLGIDEDKIRVVYNAVQDFSVNPRKKDREGCDLNILYLSNLIQTKGYDTFLESILRLSKKTDRKLNVKLVGKLLDYEKGSFATNSEARDWILRQLKKINKSKYVHIEWIQGAYGDEKIQLFTDADIFVFPTRYRVEAQPVVLIEALAVGCAIITTKMGEIPEAMEDAVVYANEHSAEDISEKLDQLIRSDEARMHFSERARKRYEECFSIDAHERIWKEIYGIED